ncbi:MAG: hypothetical protein ACXADL_16730 [Candidatus Thorarchaeota archaeon]
MGFRLHRTAVNPEGVASQDGLRNARLVLLHVNLIELYFGRETPRPRLYLRLTEKGRKVAEHLKAIEDLLSES